MKIGIIVILAAFVVFLGVQIWNFENRAKDAEQNLLKSQNDLSVVNAEKAKLESDKQYLEDPENLEKELKSRFNYRRPDEKLLIIVPSKTSTQTTTTQ